MVRGRVPVSDLAALLGSWGKEGDLIGSGQLNERLSATLVVGERAVVAEAEAMGDGLRERFSVAVEGRGVEIVCTGRAG